MFKKITGFIIGALLIGLFMSNYSNAQHAGTTTTTSTSTTKIYKNPYPIFTLSPMAGVLFPIGELGNVYQAGFTGGLDAGLRLNREVGIFLKFGYFSLTSQDDTPNASYIEVSAGPRYIFTDPKLKSNFFIEAGVGAYIFNRDAHTVGTVVIPKESQTNLGVNVGPGVTLQLSDAMDFILKTKFHAIFTEGGGTRSLISAMGGLEFKF